MFALILRALSFHPSLRERPMKVGLYLINQQHLDTDMTTALREQIAMVHAARDGGWDSLFTGQHYLNEGNNKQLASVPFLARLMGECGDMAPGMGIFLLTLHNPVQVAETVATLDILSGGRFIFGVGLGYRAIEFDAFGIAKGTRVSRFEECLDVARRLWRGEAVSLERPWCRLEQAVLNTLPVQKPHPPIWFGATSEGAVRRAARLADTLFIDPLADFTTIRSRNAIFRDELTKVGRPFPAEFPVFREICVAKDRRTAMDIAAPALLGKYADYARWGIGKGVTEPDLEALANERFFIGSPEDCYEQMRPFWEEFGYNHLVLRPHWAGMPVSAALNSIRLITDELLPALRKL
jgi:alkanesulfonate monooxygenase SsuD/methylene tetrahydromethanopterin reductase-like flavin-dependent oxidoreductase (luciferase family)